MECIIYHSLYLSLGIFSLFLYLYFRGGAATFVHWGSSSCSNLTANIVYSGFAGGGWYNYAGSGTNYLCLPRDPQYGNGSHAVSASYVNYIYGVEYETNFFGDKSADEDAPCAVCQSIMGSNVLMIPGRNTCYQGWTMQYKGYIASSYYAQVAQSEYVCVDEKAEYLFGGERGTDGALFYPAVYACGALQCPPYKKGEPVTCVVCSK